MRGSGTHEFLPRFFLCRVGFYILTRRAVYAMLKPVLFTVYNAQYKHTKGDPLWLLPGNCGDEV